jgi:copper chaperone
MRYPYGGIAMQTVQLKISGMSCDHCVARVNKALDGLDGVQVDRVRIGAAEVRFDPAAHSADELVEALRDVGYEATVAA